MDRILLVLIAVVGLLQVTGGPACDLAADVVDQVQTADHEGDCCPEGSDQAGHCCDWDHGACCAMSVVAAMPPSARVPDREPVPPLIELRPTLSLHLLLPRDNGPPPTPPPIA